MVGVANYSGRDLIVEYLDSGQEYRVPWGRTVDLDGGRVVRFKVEGVWTSSAYQLPDNYDLLNIYYYPEPYTPVTTQLDYAAPNYQRVVCSEGLRQSTAITGDAVSNSAYIGLNLPGVRPGTNCQWVSDLTWWAKLLIGALIVVALILVVSSITYIVRRQ